MSDPCPMHVYAKTITLFCGGLHVQPGISSCTLCGRPYYPACASNKVTQWSRLTGFVAVVSGFNMGIEQELKDMRMY